MRESVFRKAVKPLVKMVVKEAVTVSVSLFLALGLRNLP